MPRSSSVPEAPPPTPPPPRSNTPDFNYALLDLVAQLENDSLRAVKLYFHRNWPPAAEPVAILFQDDGVIEHVPHDVAIEASPHVIIRQPVNLMSSQVFDDSDSESSAEDGSESPCGGENEPPRRWNPLWKLLAIPIILAILIAQLLKEQLSYPLVIPLHLPIIHTIQTVTRPKAIESAIFNTRLYNQRLYTGFQTLTDWSLRYDNDVPSSGSLWTRPLWSTTDNDEATLRYPKAEIEDMRDMNTQLKEIHNGMKMKVLSGLRDINSDLENFESDFLTPLVQGLLERHEGDEREVWHKELKMKRNWSKLITKRVPDIYGKVPDKAKGYIRRNPNSWKEKIEQNTTSTTIVPILSDITHNIGQVIISIQAMENLTIQLKARMLLHDAPSTEFLDLETLPKVRASLEFLFRQFCRRRDEIVALGSLLEGQEDLWTAAIANGVLDKESVGVNAGTRWKRAKILVPRGDLMRDEIRAVWERFWVE